MSAAGLDVVQHAVEVPTCPRQTWLESALDLLFPPRCVGCGNFGGWICEKCWTQAAWVKSRLCSSCERPSPVSPCPKCRGISTRLDGVAAVCRFEGVAREAVHALKYEERFAIASLMGRLMAQAAPETTPDFVVPLPLHSSRRRERGYDQADLLAREVSKAVGVPELRLLKRTRKTADQVRLDKEARRSNVADAFVAQDVPKGCEVLLVDDVMTTGATMEEGAKALKDGGAGTVIGLTFALADAYQG